MFPDLYPHQKAILNLLSPGRDSCTTSKRAKDRKALIGKTIKYLRDCDIDKSGRGLFFPKWGIVDDAFGRELLMDSGTYLSAGALREVVLIENEDESNG